MAATVIAALVVAGAFVPGGAPAAECGGFVRPVPGPIVRPYAPDGLYGGHWGVDLAAEHSSPVRAAAAGTVTFVGVVAGVRSVTIHHGGGLRTSYSYLSAARIGRGPVVRGAIVGHTGTDHGRDALHFSLRLRDQYLDPMLVLSCRALPPFAGLELLPAGIRRVPAS